MPKIDLNAQSDEFINELLKFLLDNNISIKDSPFTYHLKDYFQDKYFYSDYILEKEQLLPTIEKWANDDKRKKYFIDNGVQTFSCHAILFRKLFLENKSIDFIDELSFEELDKGITFIATDNGFSRPFIGNNQKNILLCVKDKGKLLIDNLNIDMIKSNAKELDIPKYKEWIKNRHICILVYFGNLPSQLSYNNEILLNYDNTTQYYYYDKLNNQLFISNVKKIDDILLEVVKENKADFNIDDYRLLCVEGRPSSEDIVIRDKKIEQLEKENTILKQQLAKYEEGNKLPTITIEKGNNTSLSIAERYEAQLEAQKQLMKKFPNWEFPEHYGEYNEKEQKPYYLSTIKASDKGKQIPILLKSYKEKNEPFKINPNEWDFLIKDKANLFIYTGSDIKRIFENDLIMNQQSITLTFSTENLDKEERLNAFAKSLHYFKELHFDFESFNISAKAESVTDIYKKNVRAFYSTNYTEADI